MPRPDVPISWGLYRWLTADSRFQVTSALLLHHPTPNRKASLGLAMYLILVIGLPVIATDKEFDQRRIYWRMVGIPSLVLMTNRTLLPSATVMVLSRRIEDPHFGKHTGGESSFSPVHPSLATTSKWALGDCDGRLFPMLIWLNILVAIGGDQTWRRLQWVIFVWQATWQQNIREQDANRSHWLADGHSTTWLPTYQR